MSGTYDMYKTTPVADLKRADQILNDENHASTHGVALASALIALAQAKMTGSLRR